MANRIDLANKAELDALRLELRDALNGYAVAPYRVSDGPPTDAPQDGQLPTIDTTNNRLYVRTNGAWRFAELGENGLGLSGEQLATLASVASKADQADVDEALALKADQADVAAALATKVNSSTYTSGIAFKADKTALDAEIEARQTGDAGTVAAVSAEATVRADADEALAAALITKVFRGSLPFNLKEEGGFGDGRDESALLTAALETGRPVYIPAGDWLFQNVQTPPQRTVIMYGDGDNTRIWSHGQPILTVNGNLSPVSDYGSFSNFRVYCDADVANGSSLFTLKKLRNFVIEQVNGGMTDDFLGTLFMADSSYLLSVRSNFWRMRRYGVPFEANAFAQPDEQQDTFNFENTVNIGSHGIVFRGTSGNYHTIKLDGWKSVANNEESSAGYDEGYVTSAVAAGATAVTVGAMISGAFTAGMPVTIAYGSALEVNKVVSVVGSTVTLAQPLRFAHDAGSSIFAHGFGASFSGNTYAIRAQDCHFELTAIGILLNGTRGFSADDCYNGAAEFVRCTNSERSVRIGPLSTNGKPSAKHSIVTIWANQGSPQRPAEVLVPGPIQIISGSAAYSVIDGQGLSANAVNYVYARTAASDGNGPLYTLGNVPGSGSNSTHERLQVGLTDVWHQKKGGMLTAQQLGTYRKAVAANYTIATDDPGIIAVTDTSATRTITLPSAGAMVNQMLTIVDESGGAGTNNITINRAGSALIAGGTSKVINTNYGTLSLYSNGSNWFAI